MLPMTPYALFLPTLGIGELTLIFVIVLILFGPGKLPDVFRSLGNGVRQFKDAARDVTDELPKDVKTDAK